MIINCYFNTFKNKISLFKLFTKLKYIILEQKYNILTTFQYRNKAVSSIGDLFQQNFE